VKRRVSHGLSPCPLPDDNEDRRLSSQLNLSRQLLEFASSPGDPILTVADQARPSEFPRFIPQKPRKPIGDESDPPGYAQPSIATIRLWRRR